LPKARVIFCHLLGGPNALLSGANCITSEASCQQNLQTELF